MISIKRLCSRKPLFLKPTYVRFASSKANPPQNDVPDITSNQNEITLYKLGQKFTIRTMISISFVNMFYWSSIISNHYFFAGKVVNGIDLAGTNPMWGYFGVAATGLIVYFTRHFAHHVVYQSYLTGDGKRVGFQVHNILGNPGRKFEVSIGNAKFLSPNTALVENAGNKSFIKNLFNSSLIPLRVEGVQGNVLVDKEGLAQEPAIKLIEILSKGQAAQVEPKVQRTDYWKKGSSKAQKQRQ